MSRNTHTTEIVLKLRDNFSKQFATVNATIKETYNNTAKMQKSISNGVVAGINEIADFGTNKVLPIVKDCISVANKYEDAFAKISTIADTSAVDMDKFFGTVRDKAVEYGSDITEVADGIYNIISATTKTAESLDIFDTAAKMSIGGFTNMNSASRLTTTLLASYGDKHSLEEIGDIIAQMQVRGATTIDELAEALPQVIPFASSAGMELADLGAAIATLTGNGLNTAMSTVALKNAINSILSPTAQAKKEFDKLNIVTGSKAFENMSFGDYLQNLKSAIGLTDTAIQKLQEMAKQEDVTEEDLKAVFDSEKVNTDVLLSMFGNLRGATAMLSLLNDMKDYKEHREYFNRDKTAGILQKQYDIQSNTMSFRQKQLEQRIENLKKDIGEEILPYQEKALGLTETFLESWKSLPKETQKSVIKGGIGLTGFFAADIVISKVLKSTILSGIAKGTLVVGKGLLAFGKQIPAIASTIAVGGKYAAGQLVVGGKAAGTALAGIGGVLKTGALKLLGAIGGVSGGPLVALTTLFSILMKKDLGKGDEIIKNEDDEKEIIEGLKNYSFTLPETERSQKITDKVDEYLKNNYHSNTTQITINNANFNGVENFDSFVNEMEKIVANTK